MKIPVKAAIFLICIILMVMVFMAITSTSARANEGKEALAPTVENTLEQLKKKGGYQIENHEEWLADFSQVLLAQIGSDSDIKISVLAADTKMGILELEVTEKYKTVKGNSKEEVCKKTVLFEEYADNHQKGYHTIRFEVNNTVFKEYTRYSDSPLIHPGNPNIPGKTFRYWKRKGQDKAADFNTMTVSGDMTFEAVFN